MPWVGRYSGRQYVMSILVEDVPISGCDSATGHGLLGLDASGISWEFGGQNYDCVHPVRLERQQLSGKWIDRAVSKSYVERSRARRGECCEMYM